MVRFRASNRVIPGSIWRINFLLAPGHRVMGLHSQPPDAVDGGSVENGKWRMENRVWRLRDGGWGWRLEDGEITCIVSANVSSLTYTSCKIRSADFTSFLARFALETTSNCRLHLESVHQVLKTVG
jgi:hypothetical protein